MAKRDDVWLRDDIQFPRLLSEIHAVGLTKKQEKQICESMDIHLQGLYEILGRADVAFDRIKAGVAP